MANLIDELLEALQAAEPYVARAYECAFPDEIENRYVLNQVREAIKKAKSVSEINQELLASLKAASTIIGHPDDAMSIHFANVIAKAEGRA